MKALLNAEGKKIWGYVFPDGEVPVKTISPIDAQIEGLGKTPVYLVDWAALVIHEREAILEHLKARFGDSRAAVETEILKSGLPLRAELVSAVSIDARFFF
jgi:hypothetical protein